MVEKKEGAEMECVGCGADLVCHMSKYEGGFENNLQWQNSDGTAHYRWKSAGKFECIIPDDEPQESSLSTIDIPEINPITSSHIDKQLILISQIEKKVISHLGNSVVPAKIGLYVKLIYDGICRE